jgi:8-oxo-dGTP pyrophosphatase MutT (NUDIX family)
MKSVPSGELPSVEIVRALLAAHQPVDAKESDSLTRIRALVETGTRPFSRQEFVPGHLTASAIVLDDRRERTLLIFHQKLQRWLQPGGHFEPGENDPSVAAAREVLEETQTATRWPGNAPIMLDVDVHLIPARKADPAHEHFDLRMLLIAATDSAKAGDGVTQARWVKPAEFPALDLDPGLQRALNKVFR